MIDFLEIDPFGGLNFNFRGTLSKEERIRLTESLAKSRGWVESSGKKDRLYRNAARTVQRRTTETGKQQRGKEVSAEFMRAVEDTLIPYGVLYEDNSALEAAEAFDCDIQVWLEAYYNTLQDAVARLNSCYNGEDAKDMHEAAGWCGCGFLAYAKIERQAAGLVAYESRKTKTRPGGVKYANMPDRYFLLVKWGGCKS
jgi:hypothetical protein